MKKLLVLSTLVTSLTAVQAQLQTNEILARVISKTPVMQQVAVPRQYCDNVPVVTQSPNSGGGAVLGALAGGAVGNAVGQGSGRAVATMLGILGGAVVGNNIEGNNQQVQNVQRCNTQTSYENRVAYYDVVYEYASNRYNIQMPTDPGLYVRLQVTPVGATQPRAPVQVAPITQSPSYYTAPVSSYNAAPEPIYVQPTYVQQPVYIAPPVAPAVFYPSPYRSYYPPVGLSLNFGYSRGYGYGRHHHRH